MSKKEKNAMLKKEKLIFDDNDIYPRSKSKKPSMEEEEDIYESSFEDEDIKYKKSGDRIKKSKKELEKQSKDEESENELEKEQSEDEESENELEKEQSENEESEPELEKEESENELEESKDESKEEESVVEAKEEFENELEESKDESKEEESELEAKEEKSENEDEDIKNIIEFAHKMTTKPKINLKASFQTLNQVKKIKLPRESKKVVIKKNPDNIFYTNIPLDITKTEQMRKDIINMTIDEFKKMPIDVIKGYYRDLEGMDVANIQKQKIVTHILKRLGISK